MARKVKITENENNTLQVVKYDEKYRKTLKMIYAQCRTLEHGKTPENVENEIYTLQDVKYGEET